VHKSASSPSRALYKRTVEIDDNFFVRLVDARDRPLSPL
jgi:hypothetical protein